MESKSKKIKIWWVGLAILALWLFMQSGGCMITDKDYQRAAKWYLRMKYNESFDLLYGEYSYSYRMYFSPKSNPEWKVMVGYTKEKGKVVFHDNYVAYQLKPEIERMVQEIAYPLYGECKVYMLPWHLTLEDDWRKENSLVALGHQGTFGILLYTYAEPEKKEEKFREYLNACIENDIRASGMYIYYMDKEDFAMVEEKKRDYISYNDIFLLRGSATRMSDNSRVYMETGWLEGKGKDER